MAQRKYEIVLEAKEQAKAAIEATTKALREQNETISFTQNLYKQTLTEEEKFRAGQEKLTQAMMTGKVGLLEYTRALDQLKKGFNETAQAQQAMQAAQARAQQSWMTQTRYNSQLDAAKGQQAQQDWYTKMRYNSQLSAGQWQGRVNADAASRLHLNLPMGEMSAGGANALQPQGYIPLNVLTGGFHTNQSRALAELVQGIGNNASRSLPQSGPTMLDRFAGGVKSLLPFGAAYAGYRVATGSFNAFLEQDEAEARLKGVLNATGRRDINFDAIQGFAARRQRSTTFGDEQTIGAGSVLATFGNIKGADFEKTLKLAQDLSTVLGTDLQESAMKLGKALEDPEQFMKSLARTGVVFSDSVKKQVVELEKAGESEKAQAILFDELTRRIGGAAEVAGASASGAWAELKSAVREVGEAIGGLAAGPMRGLADLLKGLVPKSQSEFTSNGALQTQGDVRARQRALTAGMRTAAANARSDENNWSFNPFVNIVRMMTARNDYTEGLSYYNQQQNLPDGLPENLSTNGGVGGLGRSFLGGILNTAPGAKKGSDGKWKGGLTLGDLITQAPSLYALGKYRLEGEGQSLMDYVGGFAGRGQAMAKEQFDKFSKQYETPAEKRDRLLKELDSYSGFVPGDRIDSVRKGIQKDYDDETKKKKKGEDTSLGATESRFLTRGPGLMQLDEVKKTNQKIDLTNKKLDALIKAMQMRGDVVLENLV